VKGFSGETRKLNARVVPESFPHRPQMSKVNIECNSYDWRVLVSSKRYPDHLSWLQVPHSKQLVTHLLSRIGGVDC